MAHEFCLDLKSLDLPYKDLVCLAPGIDIPLVGSDA